jgi:protein farnesyltransferase/geranylgeranyltransferase type-1 subunit alpha
MPPSVPSYASSPIWADVVPIPQDDGGPNPLAAIAYSEEYSEAMSYLRAVIGQPEFSERALDLTRHIITLNPAHYTVWYVLPHSPLIQYSHH